MTPEAKVRRARAWLRYAERDLRVARAALRPAAEAEPYHAAFWAQQAAEKALKAALVYAGIPFDRTHDLDALVGLLPADWQTRRVAGALGELSGYGVETRYPDLGEPEPTAEDARAPSLRHWPYTKLCDATWKRMASLSRRKRGATSAARRR